MKPLLLSSLGYFLLVFTAGFILGIVRVGLLIPEMGERNAELIEIPVMLLVIYFSARLVVTRFPALARLSAYLVLGLIALVLLLLIEFTLVLGLWGLSLAEYFTARDPVSGMAYAVSLLIYLLMPFLLARKRFHGYKT